MQPIEQSYNREGKGLHGHNIQRDLDTGGTPAAAAVVVEFWVGMVYNEAVAQETGSVPFFC